MDGSCPAMGKSRVNEMIRLRDEAIRLLSDFTDTDIRELDRRLRFTAVPDGSPQSASGENRSSKGGHGDPTGEQALARGVVHPNDPQVEAAQSIHRHLIDATHSSRHLARAMDLINNIPIVKENHDSPPGSGPCVACDAWCSGAENDRRVSGYCPRCKQAWFRFRKANPDKERRDFEKERRRYLSGLLAPGGGG